MAAAWTPSRYSRLRVTEGPVIWGAQIKRELTIPVQCALSAFYLLGTARALSV